MALNPFEQLRNVCPEPRQAFEDAVSDILRATIPTSRRIRVYRGDGGIDVYTGTFEQTGTVEVFQIKYFPEPWAESQKDQIRSSFRTARSSKDYNLGKWTLCVPVRLTKEDIRWFDSWRARQKVPIAILDGDDLTTQLARSECASISQRLTGFGVQGLRPAGPRFVVQGRIHGGDTRSGFMSVVDVFFSNEGDRTARNVHAVVAHSATSCVASSHDENVWDEDRSGMFQALNPRRLRLLQDLNPGQRRRILAIPLCDRTAAPFSVCVQISAEDQPPITVLAEIPVIDATSHGASLTFRPRNELQVWRE